MRIAHFSDIHVLDLTGVRPWAFANKRAVGGLNLLLSRAREYSQQVLARLVDDVNQQRPDHILVSGDISNLSLRAEFVRAREILDRLSLPPSEVTLVPGNHDCYTRSAKRRDDFSDVFAPYLRGDFVAGDRVEWPFLRIRGDLALVAINTAHPSLPLLAVGTVGERQRQAVARLLADERVADRFRLVMLHHPPHVANAHWHNRLTDSDKFVEMLSEAGAELLIHGHLHRTLRHQIESRHGQIPVVGVNSGSWLSPKDATRRARYNIYQIEGRQLVRIEQRSYHPDADAFIAD